MVRPCRIRNLHSVEPAIAVQRHGPDMSGALYCQKEVPGVYIVNEYIVVICPGFVQKNGAHPYVTFGCFSTEKFGKNRILEHSEFVEVVDGLVPSVLHYFGNCGDALQR